MLKKLFNMDQSMFEITAGDWHLPVKCIERPVILL